MLRKTELVWTVEVAEGRADANHVGFNTYSGLAKDASSAAKKAVALAKEDGCRKPFVQSVKAAMTCDF